MPSFNLFYPKPENYKIKNWCDAAGVAREQQKKAEVRERFQQNGLFLIGVWRIV